MELVGNTSRGKLEGVNSPLEVGVPVRAAERQLKTIPSSTKQMPG